MADQLNVLVICGSLRKGSYNAALTRALPALAAGETYAYPADLTAEQAQQEAVATIDRNFGKEEQYANAVYNLGCYYALRGRSAEAIAQVREALAVNTKLTDLAKEDVDLVSLHDLPEYQALYTA